MSSVILCLVSFLTIFAITEQASKSLLEIEQILKELAAQTNPKNRAKNLQNAPNYLQRGYQQQHNRYQNSPNSLEAQGQGFFYQLNQARIQKQLEDDLEQAQRIESDRICKATGRCGCSGGRCGNPYRSKDKTVDDVEQILKELNEELHKSQNKNLQGDLYRQQKYNDRSQRYWDRNQDQNDRKQRYEENRQRIGQRQQYDERKQEYDDRKQEQEDRRQRRQRYDEQRHQFSDQRQQYDDRRQQYDDRRERFDQQREEFDDQHQQYDDRRQRYDDRQQKRDEGYERKRQQIEDDEDDNIDQTLQRKIKKYNNNDEFDIIVLEVPEKETSNRNEDMKIIDVSELSLRDLLQQ